MSLQAYIDHTHLSLPTPSNGFAPAGVFTGRSGYLRPGFPAPFPSHRATAQLVWGLGYRFTHDVTGAAPTLALFAAAPRSPSFQWIRRRQVPAARRPVPDGGIRSWNTTTTPASSTSRALAQQWNYTLPANALGGGIARRANAVAASTVTCVSPRYCRRRSRRASSTVEATSTPRS